MNRLMLRWTSVIAFFISMMPFAFGDGKAMTARFLAGPQGFTQPKIKLQFEEKNFVLTGKAGKKRRSFTVPLQNVTFIAHSPVRFNRAGQVSKTVPNADLPRMGSCSGIGCAGNILVLFAWGAYEAGRGTAIGVAATQHGTQHFITIDWRDEGVEYELLLEVSKDDYTSLIKQLEDASGKKAFDFEARWKRAEADIQREKSHAESVTLKKVVRIGELSLAPAVYSMVTIQREGSSGEVYFFEGKRFDSPAFRAVAPVTIAEAMPPATLKEPDVNYTDTMPAEIREIRTATRTLTFITVAEPATVGTQDSPKTSSAPQQ